MIKFITNRQDSPSSLSDISIHDNLANSKRLTHAQLSVSRVGGAKYVADAHSLKCSLFSRCTHFSLQRQYMNHYESVSVFMLGDKMYIE